jgi:hypothetical protein
MLAAPLALVPTIAHADATVPPPKTPPATPPIKRAPGVKPAPKPPAERPPPPPLEGEYMRVEPPSREQISILLHPHAPGEPCRKVIG